MNWLDGVIILIAIFFALEGLGRSFVAESLDFASFLLALFLFLRFYGNLSSLLQQQFLVPHSLATVLAFLLLWFLIEVVFFTAVHLGLHKIKIKEEHLKLLNKFSLVPAFLRGLVFIAIILVIVGTFPIQPQIKLAVNDSKIGSVILDKTQGLESPLKNIFGGITQDTLTFLTIKPKSDELVNLGFQTVDFYPSSILEDQMIAMVNKERVSKGQSVLEKVDKLTEVGRAHCADMFKRGYFSHYSPEGKNVADRVSKLGILYLVIGENLAYAPNLNLAHNGLMNSPGHRANILSGDYNKIGIGIMDGGVYGLMITQVFSN